MLWAQSRDLALPDLLLPWGLVLAWAFSMLVVNYFAGRSRLSGNTTLAMALAKSTTTVFSVGTDNVAHYFYGNKYLAEPLEDLLGSLPGLYNDIERARREGAFTAFYALEQRFYRAHFLPSVDRERSIDVVLVDVTREQQQSSELDLSDKIFHNTSDAIMVTDRRRYIDQVNHQFSVITGFSAHDVKGQRLGFPVSPEGPATFYRQVLGSLKKDGYWCGDVWSKRKNGEMFSGRMKVAVNQGKDGKVRNYIAFFSDITELRRSEEELRYLANHDTLTNLPNRRLFFDRIDQAIKRTRRSNGQFAVYFVDLDNFKAVNDELGHPVGDELLKAVSSRLLAVVRESDTVARLAGDEFTIVAEQVDSIEEIKSIAEKITRCFDPAFLLGEHEVFASASVGVGVYPADGDDMMQLIKAADTAMYKAKSERGRGSFFMISGSDEDCVIDDFFAAELHHAMDRGQLRLVYQPQVLLQSGEVVGCEALLRWQHQKLGQVQPGQFMPIAEEEGLFSEMEFWMLRQVCEQMVRWLQQKLPLQFITLNVTGHQLSNGVFVDKVKDALALTGLPPDHLVIEVSERSLIENLSVAKEFIETLRNIGVETVIDDFGVTRSEFGYLKRLPVSGIKIDNQHLSHIKRGQQGDVLFRAMIGMGEILGIDVVAEGVERGMQEHYLQDVGCRFAQGYLYGKPMAAESFQQLFDLAPKTDSA